jgi:hypothetical protein
MKHRFKTPHKHRRMTKLFTLDPKNGRIEGQPTNQISEGGNYFPLDKSDRSPQVKNLRGKATAGGDIEIESGKKFTFVRFSADPVTGGPSRSELAPRLMTPFDQSVTVRMVFRVNAPNIDQLTGYVVQFWQPVISPIAGIRVKDGRLEVVARSGGSAGSTRLTGGWNDLTVTLRPSNSQGFLRVDGDITGRVDGRINGGSQAGRADSDIFRPKFGWYGSLQQSVAVDVRLFEMSIGA